jgi:protein-disulfide isomerase
VKRGAAAAATPAAAKGLSRFNPVGLALTLALGLGLGIAVDRGLLGARVVAPGADAVPGGAPAVARAAPPQQPSAAAAATAARVPLRPDEPFEGPSLAPVTLVVFSDFQCPFCAKVEPTLRQLEAAYPGKVRLAFRHQPLPFHQGALPAARAAEAARAQGKFWEMEARLFADQQALTEQRFADDARQLGLDVDRFKRDAASEATGRRIAEDQRLATEVGATGTPTTFVNCRKLVGAVALDAFKALIDEELRKTDALRKSGVALDAAFYDRVCAANVAAAPPAAAPAPTTGLKVSLRPDDPARGQPRAAVTVVEFSDFQCPFCSRAVPAVEEVERTFGQDVRVVWKHLPLPFHQNALPAALAAEAARVQGKFWEMHDRLFAGQQALSEESYLGHARALGLDLARFQAARQAPETRRRVEEDAAAAASAGVTGTPSFIVDGELVLGSAGLRAAVQRHLDQARLARK